MDLDELYSFTNFKYFNDCNNLSDVDEDSDYEFASIILEHEDYTVHLVDKRIRSSQFQTFMEKLVDELRTEIKTLLTAIELRQDEKQFRLPEFDNYCFRLSAWDLNRPFRKEECFYKRCYDCLKEAE